MQSDQAKLTFAEMAEILEATGNYRVLRKLQPRPTEHSLTPDPSVRNAIVLDVETTGFDTERDEIIEIGMVKFDYSREDHVLGVIGTLSSLNEPIEAIPDEVAKITKITQDMVTGHHIEIEAINAFVAGSSVIIAHNAQFDRPFVERYWPVFESKPWACSATQIDWLSYGYEGARLAYLLNEIGFFHSSHRALDDCYALLEILARDLRNASTPALNVLLEQARRKTVRIWAEGAPYEFRYELRRRRYRWNDGSDGRARSWYIELPENHVQAELDFLERNVYGRATTLNIETLDAMIRYSRRRKDL